MVYNNDNERRTGNGKSCHILKGVLIMTYAKNSTITAIHRPITNGMYNDTYTVIYSNGIRRNYTIKGAMNKKHFEFIQSATVESRYSKHTGKHTADIFTAPAEPKEEPTTEDQTAEEPAEVQAEEPAAEKPAENKTNSAFITEMFAALGYFKRVLWSYTAAEGGTRSERDIHGDFWGAHECSVILSFVNVLLKAQGAEPHYKLKNDFDDLTECFEEIMQKFEYGDKRTIEEIISEYNFT